MAAREREKEREGKEMARHGGVGHGVGFGERV